MTLSSVPAAREHADQVHGLADRLGVSNEKLHHVEHERDRLRDFVSHQRGEHIPDENGWCRGEHAVLVPAPCWFRDLCDEALRPACKRCGRIAELFISGWCGDCDALIGVQTTVTCTRCAKQHARNRDCVEDSFDPRDHDDRPGSDEQ